MTSEVLHFDSSSPEGAPFCLYSKDHGRKLTEGMQLLRLQNSLIDLEIVCLEDQEPLKAHKCVLASISAFFRVNLTRCDLPNVPALVKLSDFGLGHVKRESLRLLLDYCYRGEVVIPPSQAENVKLTADLLGFECNAPKSHGQESANSGQVVAPLLSNSEQQNFAQSEAFHFDYHHQQQQQQQQQHVWNYVEEEEDVTLFVSKVK